MPTTPSAASKDLSLPVTVEQILAMDHGWVRPEERPVCIVDLAIPCGRPDDIGPLAELLRTIPCVTIGTLPADPSLDDLVPLFDLVLPPGDPRIIQAVDLVRKQPTASITLAVLLRQQQKNDAHSGVVAESASYSTLQSGREFATWLHSRSPYRPSTPPSVPATPRVVMSLEDGVVVIRLNRPARHNAIDRQMRQELFDALMVATGRPEPVRLEGAGRSFSSGGDLDEFGSFSDPAEAHLVRLAAHPGLAMLSVTSVRLTARVHGHCLGGGLELAAFAGRVEAAPRTCFGLPETRMGLLPGAGGTVSLTARIGRQRVLELALCHDTIDTTTALHWGLIDAVI